MNPAHADAQYPADWQADDLPTLIALAGEGGWEGRRVLDLDGLEVEDSADLVAALNAVRALLPERDASLVIIRAPQLLCHNLYRVGLLEGGRVQVVEMCEDQAYG